MTRENLRVAAGLVALLIVWEAVGRLTPLGHSVTASPSLILEQFWQDGDLYRLHMIATIRSASLGFVFGSGAAILAAIVFCRFPVVEGLFGGVNVAMFAMPPIVVGPVLVLIFSGNRPQIILAALVVYFPTMAATLVGLRDVDPRLVDLVHSYGGRANRVMRLVRLRSAAPSILAGLRTASTLAVLGAILGEFGSGTRWGLGSFLLGSLGAGDPARLWGVGLSATAISMAGFALFSWIGRKVGGRTISVTLASSRLPDQIAVAGRYGPGARVLLTLGAIATPFVLWWLILRLSGLSEIIAPTPSDVFAYLFTDPHAADARQTLLTALGETLPLAALGLACGLGAAFGLAALSVVRPTVVKTILPVALLLQTTPLVALAPIVLLIFGRDATASVVLAVLVVFLPAYVLLAQGFAQTPPAAKELVQVYGGGKMKELWMVSVPHATPYLFAAAKLVAPRALLGVMVAEWLLSGVGLGNLLNASRGLLDYDMVWAGALVSILISIAAYQVVNAIEKIVA